jgi:hypothetical protein
MVISQQINVKVQNKLNFKYRHFRDTVAESMATGVIKKEEVPACVLII